jgi:hypothetical protein
MRKTLTLISIVVAAGSLAACKMFWEHDPAPPAVATTTAPTDPTTTAEASKPTDQMASTSTDQPAVAEKTETPPVPAKK